MSARLDIIEFLLHDELLGFTREPGKTNSLSPAQECLLKAIYALPLTPEERTIWAACTGREPEDYPEGDPPDEITVVAGARSGKDSRILVPVMLYEMALGGHEQYLGKGEVGVVPLIGPTERSADIAYGLGRRYMATSKQLKRLIEPGGERERALWLTNNTRLMTFACTAGGLRGWTFIAAGLDEVAHFRAVAGSEADVEIQQAIRRGTVGLPHAKIVKISTPFGRHGLLWQDFEHFYGKAGAPVLVWRAGTSTMNPSVTPARIARERQRDARRAEREYDAEFGVDVEGLFSWARLEAVRVGGRGAVPPDPDRSYVAGIDPSGGGADEFACAIAHAEEAHTIVVDYVAGWKGRAGEAVELTGVVAEIAEMLRRYRVGTVRGDRYAAGWVEQEFRKHGIAYQVAEQDKSRCYRDTVPFVNEGRIQLPDDGVLLAQFAGLEERWKAGGRVLTVDHPRGGRDDRANAVAIAAAELARRMAPVVAGTLEDFQAAAAERGDVGPGLVAAGAAATAGFFGRDMPSFLVARRERDDHREPSEPGEGRRGSMRMWRH